MAKPQRGRRIADEHKDDALPAEPLRTVRGKAAPEGPLALDRLIHERLRLGILSALAVNESLSFNDLTIDPIAREVRLHQQPIELTPREFDLLYFFARHPGQVFSRLSLLNQVWGYQHEGYEHTVNTHINRLRIKIERNPAEPERILTVWGMGYKFAAAPQE